MNFKNAILIVSGEPNSIFLEIFFKALKKTKTTKPLVLIASYNLLKLQMKKLKYKKKVPKNVGYKDLELFSFDKSDGKLKLPLINKLNLNPYDIIVEDNREFIFDNSFYILN